MHEKLVEPLGFESDAYWLVDGTGMEMAFAGLNVTARDFAKLGELYRNNGRADALLRFIERQARAQGLHRLFVLTTRTAHWFRERGFEPAEVGDLPMGKQALYNWQRRSKVFIKSL
jgi:amino-acid N-acetyltransferase